MEIIIKVNKIEGSNYFEIIKDGKRYSGTYARDNALEDLDNLI